MQLKTDNISESKSRAAANCFVQRKSLKESAFRFIDNRPEAIAQRKLQELTENSPKMERLRAFQNMADNRAQAKQAAQLQPMPPTNPTQQQELIPKTEYGTGLSDSQMKGIEKPSEDSMNDVKVYYTSDKPAQLQAGEYAKGTDLPGQKKYLPRDSWQVVQNNQRRINPAMQMKEEMNINNKAGLEQEPDIMGAKALQSNEPINQVKSFVMPAQTLLHSNVVQGAFKINDVSLVGEALNTWLETYTTGRPELEAVVRSWAAEVGHTDNYDNDLAAFAAAEKTAKSKIEISNAAVGKSIGTNNPPNAVDWSTYPVWAAWYFNGLEYQNNSSNGWHSNRAGLLPGGAATADGVPTRFVEFRRPGSIGTKEVDKMERCIFDLLSGRCWPNAHYDGGYVEITGIPGTIKQNLLNIALNYTGINDRAKEMTAAEKATAGVGFAKIAWLINTLKNEAGVV